MSLPAAQTVDEAAAVFLMPGALHCAAVSTQVTTILGSCVSVCLWDEVRRLGGMNHFVLPRRRHNATGPRFGDVAIDLLVNGMIRLGCRPEHMQAKVFGGASVLPYCIQGPSVGTLNVETALDHLHDLDIPVVAGQTGGDIGMWIRLRTDTGEVLARPLARRADRLCDLCGGTPAEKPRKCRGSRGCGAPAPPAAE
jgi:chemotaxis protein CheD